MNHYPVISDTDAIYFALKDLPVVTESFSSKHKSRGTYVAVLTIYFLGRLEKLRVNACSRSLSMLDNGGNV